MSNSDDVLTEKILQDLIVVVSNNISISSLEIIPRRASESKNTSPVHIGGDYALGIESWAAQMIYLYSHKKLISEPRIKNARQYAPYLLAAVLLNPDMSLGWIRRRELIERRKLPVKDELRITQMALSLKPKCNEALVHRRWLIKEQIIPTNNISNIVYEELFIVSLAADKHPNNYNAWSHGHWALEYLISDATPSYSFMSPKFLICLKVLDDNLEFISSHVSDYSSMHFRHLLIRHIFQCFKDYFKNSCSQSFSLNNLPKTDNSFFELLQKSLVEFCTQSSVLINYSKNFEKCLTLFDIIAGVLLAELKTNLSMSLIFPDHEALWCFRRCLVHTFRETLMSEEIQSLYVSRSPEFRDKNGAICAKDIRLSDLEFSLLRKTVADLLLSNEHAVCKDFARESGPIKNYSIWLKQACKFNF